jgi:hypothetical protein
MCLTGATCLHDSCCFSEFYKNPTPHVNLVQSGHQHPIRMWLFITMVWMKHCSLGSKELLCTHPLSSISIIVYQICKKKHLNIDCFKTYETLVPTWTKMLLESSLGYILSKLYLMIQQISNLRIFVHCLF